MTAPQPFDFADRLQAVQPTAVNSILAEMRELQASGQTLVSLMRGEPDLPTPQHITEACFRALRDGRTGYPDNRGEKHFREAVAQKLARENQLSYDPGIEVLATSGGTFGIYAALMAVLNEGDEVLLPDPIYDAYQSPIRLCGGRIEPVLSRIENGRFVIDLDALKAAWSQRARMLILNTPWNPVGTVLRHEELTAIAEFCEDRNLILVSDEIYEAITYEGHRHISPLQAAPGLRDRFILVNSLSKTYSMTGWRVGYCAAPARIIQAMFMVLAQSSRGPATFIQDAAAVALSGPQECVTQACAEYSRRRAHVLEQLKDIPGVQILTPEGGFFAMADVRSASIPSNEIRQRLLKEFGVAVVHGMAYGAGGEGTLRVSFASGGETLTRGVERLRAGLIAIVEGAR